MTRVGKKGRKPVSRSAALAMAMSLALLAGLSGCASENETEPSSITARLRAVMREDGVLVVEGLPWNSEQETVMQVQGWTEEDLADAVYVEGDSPMTITERMPQEDVGASVRFMNGYYSEEIDGDSGVTGYTDGGLVSSGYWYYFDTEEEARSFFEEYGTALTEQFSEEVIWSEGRSAIEQSWFGNTARKSYMMIEYKGSTDDFVIGPIGPETDDPAYVVLIVLQGPVE